MGLTPRRTMPYIAMAAALAVVLFSSPSPAFILPCAFTGVTTFSPAHPQANDPLTFDIVVYDAYMDGDVVLGKTSLGPGDQIAFDIVVTRASAAGAFPDYQVYAVIGAFNAAKIEGAIDALPVGQYAVTTSVRVFDPPAGFTNPCGLKTTSLFVYVDDGLAPVIEYYDSTLDHYFLTQNTDEIASLDAGVHPGWVRTDQSFLAYRPAQGVGQPVFRYYGLPSAGLDTHLFLLEDDVPDLMYIFSFPFGLVWRLESDDAFDLDFPSTVVDGSNVPGTCPQGEVPVYRLWNQRVDSDHRYTTDPAIKAQMIAKGYVAEGYGPDAVEMCAFTR